MGRFVAICQNEAGEQYWWFQDKPYGRCAEPDCECQPKFYVEADRPQRTRRAKARVRRSGNQG